jgi:uncharacterized protein (TIGR00255 family)
MTGFGAASRELPKGTLTVELKSVNHRHLNVSFRLPQGAESWEPGLRAHLAKRIKRGHISFLVGASPAPGSSRHWEIDRERLDATLTALRELREEHGLSGEIDMGLTVSAVRELLRDERTDDLGWVDAAVLDEVVDEAIDELVEMRETEGSRLEEDLAGCLEEIDAALRAVETLTPLRLTRERDRLRRAVSELSDGIHLDAGRLEQEIALIADKWDIGEEVVRARAHLAAFRDLLRSDAGEPVGKRLAFLIQELNREVNTVGSKANDTEISRHVVETKNGLERLREQVENIE